MGFNCIFYENASNIRKKVDVSEPKYICIMPRKKIINKDENKFRLSSFCYVIYHRYIVFIGVNAPFIIGYMYIVVVENNSF
jgi:hypothetical protein